MQTYISSYRDFEWRFTFEQKESHEEPEQGANDTALTEQTTQHIFYYRAQCTHIHTHTHTTRTIRLSGCRSLTPTKSSEYSIHYTLYSLRRIFALISHTDIS